MTQVTICKGRDTTISIKGHAGFNPGNDIVCAGVSTLAYALINTLIEDMTKFDFNDTPGNFHIVIHEITPYVHMFEIGIKALAEHFPDNVEVI